jgi:endopolyphosphatase
VPLLLSLCFPSGDPRYECLNIFQHSSVSNTFFGSKVSITAVFGVESADESRKVPAFSIHILKPILAMRVTCVLFLALHALPSRAGILKGWGSNSKKQTVLIEGDQTVGRAWKDDASELESLLGTDRSHALSREGEQATRKLTGKFLHITDVHPDPYYKVHSNTDVEGACHRGKGPAGYYGAETTDCDSPLTLVNATFEWIRQNLRDEVDFVIWTGDSARHDNDEDIPRSPKQVIEQNEILVKAFLHAFGKDDNFDDDDPLNDFVVPIIPSFGNNDVLPHNIMVEGPNEWTTRYLTTWRQFIPEHERHQFHRGGWFTVEVIPNKLAVFSLNTLYFFASNSGVDGCVSKHEPGFEQFEWLRVQLTELRRRGMKAILMGHIPPARTESKTSWEESCWQKYTLWMHSFRDVIVAGLYGHMNIDHFMLQDFDDVKKHVRKGIEYNEDDGVNDDVRKRNKKSKFSITSAQDYLVSLRDTFSRIPKLSAKPKSDKKLPDYGKIGGEFGERYSLTLVAPSVVPNYFPTIRVFSYNISGLEDLDVPFPGRREPQAPGIIDDPNERLELRDVDEESAKKKKKKPHKFHLPVPPSATSLPGPAYSPQSLTLLSYTQYYANLTYINNDFVESRSWINRWKPGKHHGKPPPKSPKPKEFVFEVEYDTAIDKVYKLKDLTVKNTLDLARRIAGDFGGKEVEDEELEDVEHDSESNSDSDGEHEESKKPKKKKGKKKKKKHGKKPKDKAKHEWYAFVHRAFVGAVEPEDIYDTFYEE